MKSVAIYCGSGIGNSESFKKDANTLGSFLAQQEITLVYGGAKVGLMGAVADGALDAGGHVIGVLPHFLKDRELEHPHVSELVLVDSMSERKQKIEELSEGFIALPGGNGTLDELFEVLTNRQLSLHSKPIGILNTDQYYHHLIQHLDHMVKSGFLREKHRSFLIVEDSPEELVRKMMT